MDQEESIHREAGLGISPVHQRSWREGLGGSRRVIESGRASGQAGGREGMRKEEKKGGGVKREGREAHRGERWKRSERGQRSERGKRERGETGESGKIEGAHRRRA
eukprot:1377767-Rhodomonas_salina.2